MRANWKRDEEERPEVSELKAVKDTQPLPPGVEHKVVTEAPSEQKSNKKKKKKSNSNSIKLKEVNK